MKNFFYLFAAMIMAVTGLVSCSDISATESPGSENLTATLKNAQQTTALINFKKAYIAMLHERSSDPKDANVPLINEGNKHIIIEQSKVLLLITGNQEDIKNTDIAIIEKAMEVYGEKNAFTNP